MQDVLSMISSPVFRFSDDKVELGFTVLNTFFPQEEATGHKEILRMRDRVKTIPDANLRDEINKKIDVLLNISKHNT